MKPRRVYAEWGPGPPKAKDRSVAATKKRQSSTIEIMQASSLTKVNSGLNGALKRSSVGVSQRRRLVISNAKAGNWYPGAASPKWLDGSLPGDYGFDPLKLGTEPDQPKWFAQAELLHARFAMP